MRRHFTVLLAMAVLGGVALLRPGAAVAGEPAVTTAHLRIELSTTSDWARIRVEGASFPVTRTLVASPVAPASFSGDAWTVSNPSLTPARFVVDTITSELSGRPDLTLRVEQGRYGSTTANIYDDSRGPEPILSQSAGGAAGGTTSTARTVSRLELLGATELALPHADPRRLVLAAYYPWFERSGNPSDKMAEEPLQPRSARDLDDVRSHAAQARAAGVDGFAFSWAGEADDGPELGLMLTAMTEQGGVVVPYLETAQATGLLGRVDKSRVAQWLDQALARAGSPAFLRAADGIPVVLVFAMEKLSADTWRAMAADSAGRGRPVHLIGDADPSVYAGASDGWHRYGASGTQSQLAGLWKTMAQRLRGPRVLDEAAPIGIDVATVSPGYDDTKLRGNQNPVIYRADGARYEQTWDAALASDPDWVLITSWNEWFEGTAIEPGTVNGDLALRQTAQWAATWRGLPSPPEPPLTTTTSTTAPPAASPPPSPLGRLLPWLSL